MDDILIAGRNMEHHDKIPNKDVERATSYNLKLNFDKCKICKASIPYMGHLTDKGLQPAPEKVRTIREMPVPTDKEDVRRFLGLVQYLEKFLPHLSQEDAPIEFY